MAALIKYLTSTGGEVHETTTPFDMAPFRAETRGGKNV